MFCLTALSLSGQVDSNSSLSEEELNVMLFGENTWELAEEKETVTAQWLPSYSGDLGVGYSDNPLYGPFLREDSYYIESSLEAFFLRQGQPEYFTYFYLYGEGKAFRDLPEIKSTSFLIGQFDHAYSPEGSSTTYGIRLRHVYYNQGFDFSELGLPYSMKMTSNKSEVIPYFSYNWSEEVSGSLEFLVGEEDFAEITDDNQDYKISLSTKGTFGSFDLKFNASVQEKHYRERKKRYQDGSIMSEEKLTTLIKAAGVKLKKSNGHSFFNSTTSKFSWSGLNDDGGGYFDYQKISLSFSQEANWKNWLIELGASASQFSYDHRSVDSGEKFERKSIKFNSLFSRPVSQNIDLYFKWSREEDFSNSRDYEYNSAFWSTGISWEI